MSFISSFDFQIVPLGGSAGGTPLDDSSNGQLPVFDLNSDGPLPDLSDTTPAASPASFASLPPAPVMRSTDSSDRPAGSLWLEGDVLMCGCPDCQAPMSIRLWLMIADCWNCATSIELSEEQEREAQRLLKQREKARQKTEERQPAQTTKPAAPTTPAQERRREPERPSPPSPTPARPNRQNRQQQESRRRPTAADNYLRRRQAQSGRVRKLFNDMPAWFVSMVLHMAALTILALLTFGEDEGEQIVLNTMVSKDLKRTGQAEIEAPDEVEFDLPVPPDVDLTDKKSREAILRDDQAARELRIVDTANPSLPKLDKIKRMISHSGGSHAALAARDPRVRVEIVKREGGTTSTEAAVARGLRWLSQQQMSDGRWQLGEWSESGGRRRFRSAGIRSDTAATSLALFPFLGAGQSHLTGRYKHEVSKGLRWLVDQQKSNGDMRGNSTRNAGMYAHAQSTMVLCEAFLMTGDEQLRIPAQKAVDFIVAAQHPRGGWRYQPGDAGDTSVVGWQLMALQSARAANLTVPESTFELASHYLDTAQYRPRGRDRSDLAALYTYTPGNGRPTPAMTAGALLCRIYTGWKKDNPYLIDAVEYLADNHMPSASSPDLYYWYYGTQVFHHMGGEYWKRWNLRMRDILVEKQVKGGSQVGSWSSLGPHVDGGGRLYMTAMCTCALEVYYRHLPIFRQIDLD